MPAMYFDTSALVKRYVSEVGSLWVRVTLAQSSRNVVYTSALAQPEVLSASAGPRCEKPTYTRLLRIA